MRRTIRLIAWASYVLQCCAGYGYSSGSGAKWVDVWTAMPQLTEPANLPSGVFNTNPKFRDTTIRQTVKLNLPSSAAGNVTQRRIRLRVSNAFGNTPLHVTSAGFARPADNRAGTSAIRPASAVSLTFNSGEQGVSIPAGALAVTDPVDFDFAGLGSYVVNGTERSGSLITVDLYLQDGQQGESITSHPGSRTTSYLVNGNRVAAANLTGQVQTQAHWYFISAVESYEQDDASSFVIIGDSITDGRGTVTDANERWPDDLFTRMQRADADGLRKIAIGNEAAGGNCVTMSRSCLGPSVVSRLDRDVLARSGLKYAMLFEGVNDIGVAPADQAIQDSVVEDLISAYSQIITRVHAVGVPIFGATITPFGATKPSVQPYSDPAGIRESSRARVNAWIRTSGKFDAVIDFDEAVRDPDNFTTLNPAFDSGDFLHLNPAGYQAMADSFPLDLFDRFASGPTDDDDDG